MWKVIRASRILRYEGFPVLGSRTPRKGLREKAKERGQWGEGAKLQSKHFSHRGFNADVTMTSSSVSSAMTEVATSPICETSACLLLYVCIIMIS